MMLINSNSVLAGKRSMGAQLLLAVLTTACLLQANAASVKICHFPPGNPANFLTLTVGSPAVPAHLDHHQGDYVGPCDCAVLCNDQDACTSDLCNTVKGGCQANHPPIDCNDSVECTVDSCDSQTGCKHTANDGLCPAGYRCDESEGCVRNLPNFVNCQPTGNADGCDGGFPCNNVGETCSNTLCFRSVDPRWQGLSLPGLCAAGPNSNSCGAQCTTDADCPTGSFCGDSCCSGFTCFEACEANAGRRLREGDAKSRTLEEGKGCGEGYAILCGDE
jgi:hypothetical protein